MNYFLRELGSGHGKTVVTVGGSTAWVVSVIDVLTSSISPPGLFNFYWFYATLILTVVVPLIYWITNSLKQKKKRETARVLKETAEVYESRKEKEVRERVKRDKNFATHCYMCLHFNPDSMVCRKKFSQDITYNRIKEITIDNKIYCLYWETENA